MNFKLRVWRQKDAKSEGRFQELEARNVSSDMSFLEMLDEVNSWAAPLGQAATQAPQPMQAAASKAASATVFGTGMMLASGAAPAVTEM